MSTAAVYNGYGQYEQTEFGEKGITLSHGGVPFWFPFEKVTYLPDYTLREVDHDKSTANGEEEGVLTYRTVRLDGRRLAEELLEIQIPTKNREKGLVPITITKDNRKNSYVEVCAGVSEEGLVLTTEVQEVVPSEMEIAEARRLAKQYKEEVIQLYFQSKRERMAGGHGQLFPTGLIRVYMNELGVQDIDDVSRMISTAAQSPGMSPEVLLQLVKDIMTAAQAQAAAAPQTAPAVAPQANPVRPQPQGKQAAQSLV